MKGFSRSASFFVFASVLAACQTDGSVNLLSTSSQTPDLQISKAFYTPFYDQAAHLRDLVEEKNYDAGAVLVTEQWEYFGAAADQNMEPLSEIARHLNERKKPSLTAALSALRADSADSPATWPQTREALAAARRVLDTYADHPLLSSGETRFRSPLFDELKTALESREGELTAAAPQSFAAFDHFGGRSFFDAYPLDLKRRDFLDAYFARLEPLWAGAGAAQIERFAKTYPAAEMGEDRWVQLGQRLHRAYLTEAAGRSPADLRTMIGALRRVADAGFPADKISDLSIAFVEVTSQTLLKEGQIMFPAQIEADLPAKLSKAELDDVFAGRGDAAYLIVFDVALAKASRKVTGIRKMPSKTIVGYRTEPNPEYNVVQNELNNARMDMTSASMNQASVDSQWCYGMGCLAKAVSQIAAGAAVAKSRDQIDALMAKLRGTPQTIQKPTYQSYRYDLATIDARKAMTVNYYVIDRRASTYFKSTFDVEERKKFDVAYQIHPDDPDKASHIASATSEEDVVEWEEGPSTVKLTQLVDHYLAHAGSAKPLPSPERLRAELLRDKNAALAKAKDETFTGTTQADPRFDSVVVVFNPDGALGSGFFVTPDVVMTNYHVVEERDFVEFKLYNGGETFGKVIARDVRLDLALVRVQTRGKPAKFLETNNLDLGSTIEVIGHPRGLQFSITRGVVSAVREMSNANIADSRKVLFVQIDAATNPGNSGGPVFLKDKVIGVVSFGRKESENLNFTVHYSEAARFLKESLDGRS